MESLDSTDPRPRIPASAGMTVRVSGLRRKDSRGGGLLVRESLTIPDEQRPCSCGQDDCKVVRFAPSARLWQDSKVGTVDSRFRGKDGLGAYSTIWRDFAIVLGSAAGSFDSQGAEIPRRARASRGW